MSTQAGTMLHPAASPRNAPSTMPNLAAGHRGLLRSLASGTALGPMLFSNSSPLLIASSLSCSRTDFITKFKVVGSL